MRIAGFVALIVLSLGVAGYATFAYGFLPVGSLVHPSMQSSFRTHPIGIYSHVFASVVALAFGPFQFLTALRNARVEVHRWMGRLYLGVGVLVGGVSGLYLAAHAFGGVASRLGFAGLAAAWLYCGLRACLAIRARNVVLHRRWMVRNFALTFAAVTLRLYLPASVASGIRFETAYPIIAWLCWVPNLIVAEMLFNRPRDSGANH